MNGQMTYNRITVLTCLSILLLSVDCYSQSLALSDNNAEKAEQKIKSMIGTKAPNWIIHEGDFNTLTDFKGSVVLLEFYGIGCGNCVLAEKDIKEIDSLYNKNKLKIVVIKVQPFNNKNKVAQISFYTESRIGQPSYVDYVDLSKKYRVEGFPTFFLIDKNGIIRYTQVGRFHDNTRSDMISQIDKLL